MGHAAGARARGTCGVDAALTEEMFRTLPRAARVSLELLHPIGQGNNVSEAKHQELLDDARVSVCRSAGAARHVHGVPHHRLDPRVLPVAARGFYCRPLPLRPRRRGVEPAGALGRLRGPYILQPRRSRAPSLGARDASRRLLPLRSIRPQGWLTRSRGYARADRRAPLRTFACTCAPKNQLDARLRRRRRVIPSDPSYPDLVPVAVAGRSARNYRCRSTSRRPPGRCTRRRPSGRSSAASTVFCWSRTFFVDGKGSKSRLARPPSRASSRRTAVYT